MSDLEYKYTYGDLTDEARAPLEDAERAVHLLEEARALLSTLVHQGRASPTEYAVVDAAVATAQNCRNRAAMNILDALRVRSRK